MIRIMILVGIKEMIMVVMMMTRQDKFQTTHVVRRVRHNLLPVMRATQN